MASADELLNEIESLRVRLEEAQEKLRSMESCEMTGKQAEEAARSNEERLQLALDAAHLGTWDWNILDGTTIWNNEHYRMLGYEPDSFAPTYRHWADRVHPDDLPVTEARIQETIKNGNDYRAEFRVVLPDGTVRIFEALGRIGRDRAGSAVRLYGAMRDISEQKQIMNALHQAKEELEQRVEERTAELRESKELFSLFMKHTPVYTFIKRIEGEQSRVIVLSDNFIDMVGRPASELLGRTMDEMFPADFAKKITADDLDVVKAEKIIQLEEELAGRSYTTIKFPIISESGDKLIAGFTLDITEKKRQEEAVRRSEHEFRMLAESMPQIVWITRPDGWNIYFNQQWVEYTGLALEESYGHGWNKPFHPEDQQRAWDAWQNAITNLSAYSLECRLRRADGVYKWWLIRGVPVLDEHGAVLKWFGTCTDIDEFKQAEEERRELEQKMLQAQKMESLGVLAGGIAHDFNNILTAIIGNADLALMKLNPESPVVTNLKQIEQSAARAADLARQMLAYSGKGKFLIENLDLNRLIEEMLHMMEVSISRKALLRLKLGQHLPVVEADATQLRQVIMNLVINASESLDEESGIITITTGSMECDRSYLGEVWLDENISAGQYVYIEIADTGCGIGKETIGKIFDPFFTTKFTGRGLGMAAVQGIVRGHKGAIKVCSEPGKGTTIRVLFPASGRPAETSRAGSSAGVWQGSGRVLLVDDEEIVRDIGAVMLKELGLKVVTAKDGVDALEMFKSGNDISFVILDLTMPNMSGDECFEELKRISPDVKVIISSGYSEQEVTQKFIGKGVAGFVQKPYRLAELEEAIKRVISCVGAGSAAHNF